MIFIYIKKERKIVFLHYIKQCYACNTYVLIVYINQNKRGKIYVIEKLYFIIRILYAKKLFYNVANGDID